MPSEKRLGGIYKGLHGEITNLENSIRDVVRKFTTLEDMKIIEQPPPRIDKLKSLL